MMEPSVTERSSADVTRTTRLLAVVVIAALGLAPTGCGDDEPATIVTIADAAERAGPVELSGFVVERDGVARLCEALLESFPPQCGEPSVTIANVYELGADLATEQDVRWTDLAVRLTGTVADGVVTIGG
jgi:hypothetical protein